MKTRLITLSVLSTLLVSAAAAADDQTVSACPQNWTKEQPLDVQLEAIYDYQECVDKLARDQMVSAAGLSAFSALNEIDKAKEKAKKDEQEVKEKQNFLGFNWGLGVGAAFGRGADRIEEAVLVNDLVRVTEEVTDMPRIVLELHNFVRRWEYKDRTIGFGPFAAVNFGATGGDTLSSFGAGVMLGIKRARGPGSFNIGIGYMLDQGVKQLGSGIEENQPLPDGETEIRFRTESEPALLVFVSTTFD